jgi:hypothetical protein
MNTPQPNELTKPWRKSSYCDTGGQCVEVAQYGTSRLVRDSTDPAGTCLAFTEQAWARFIRHVRTCSTACNPPGE